MTADFVIEWVAENRKFSRPQIGAELMKKGHDAPIPLRLEPPTTDPPGVIEVVHVPELSSETVAVLRAELTKDVLRAKDFYDRVERPVKVEITAVPVDDALADAIGPEVRSCTVGVEVPKPVLHWRGPPFERDDAPIEVDADGEHEFELRTWVDQYRPVEGDIGYDPTLVEFSHKTAEGFDPRMFGPHPDDRPWVVAPAGGSNNREFSRWISKLALPHPDVKGVVPPVRTVIHVQVWPKGAITKRVKDEVVHRRGALLDDQIEVVLRPVALVPELVRPVGPFDADGKEVGAALRISRQRDGKPLKRGVISWEVKGEGSRGTTVRPDQVELLEADGGETTLWVTPPELTYQPFERYRDDLIVYAGAGADRRQIGIVPLLLRPAIKASISADKKGFDREERGAIELKAISSACVIKGTVSYEATNVDPHETKTFPVCHAAVQIVCDDGKSSVDLKTDEEGQFVWELPELEEVFKKIPEEREYELTADRERPVLSLSERREGPGQPSAEDVLAMYDDKVRAYAPLELLSTPLQNDLKRYGLTFCGQLCKEPEASYDKIVSASELLRVGAAGASTWRSINDKLWARGGTDVANFLSEGLATLISAGNIGPLLATGLQKSVSALRRIPSIIPLLEEIVSVCTMITARLARGAPATLSAAFSALHANATQVLGHLRRVAVETAQRDSVAGVATLARVIGEVIVVLAEAAWAVARGLFWAIASMVGHTLGAVSERIAIARPTLQWLSDISTRYFGTKDTVNQFTLAKLMEMLAGAFTDWISTAEKEGANVASAVRQRFQLFGPAVEDALRRNLSASSALLVPASAVGAVKAYNQATMSMNVGASDFIKQHIEIDLLMKLLDIVILEAEAIGMFLVGWFSGGTAAVALAPAISEFEVFVGALKMLLMRGTQGLTTFWMAVGTSINCHAATSGLTTAPAAP